MPHASANRVHTARFLRDRDGQEARVTNIELFFDLIYAFAVTQLSHRLIHDQSAATALQTLILWFAVWLGWQYTCWVTNWFDPDRIPVRMLLFAVMATGMVMSAALPLAYATNSVRGLVFAISYVTIQVGRSIVVLWFLGGRHALTANFRRICGWLAISGVAWLAGGWLGGYARVACWSVAVLCEYVSPMFGFALPVLGRSRADEWRTVAGGHLTERCQAFVIIALGESLLVTGGTLSELEAWDAPALIAFLVCFLGSVAMWWIYFDTSSNAASRAIEKSREPGLMAAYYQYVHVILIAGVIVSAAADDLVMVHPDQRVVLSTAWLLTGGPAIYIAGNGLYKRVVYGWFPLSHWIGLALLTLVAVASFYTDLLMTDGLTTLVMIVVAAWESVSRRVSPNARRVSTE